MSWVAVAVAGAGLVGGIMQSNAASDAASQAANASNNATQAQLSMFNTTNAQQAPWRQAGQTALNQILGGFGEPGISTPGSGQPPSQGDTWGWLNGHDSSGGAGWLTQTGSPDANQSSPTTALANVNGLPSGYFNHQFNAADLNSNLAPNYQWQLGQGLGAMQNSAAGTSGLVSGNALRGLNDYAQNFAGNSYQNAFNNYNTQQSNIFNRLSTIAGMGSASAMNSANVGAQTGAGMANSIMTGGQALAAGTMGSANALSRGFNNAAGSWYGANAMQNGSNSINGPVWGNNGSLQNDAGTFASM